MLGNLYTEFQQHNPASQGDPATSVDMLESRNFPALEQAIEVNTRSGGELKAGLKGAEGWVERGPLLSPEEDGCSSEGQLHH